MRGTGARIAQWMGTVCELLRQPLTGMPTSVVLDQLQATFDVTAVSWNWAEADGSMGLLIRPHDAFDPVAAELEAWRAGELHDCHPLFTWYLHTGDSRPQTCQRVPTRLVPLERRERIEGPLRPLGLEHQMVINYRLDGPMHRAFLMGRGGRDFSDDDLLVAGHVQRAVVALDVQSRLVSRLSAVDRRLPDSIGDLSVTGRELAVLQLLAEGQPTRVIARRLGCSPRTVQKHLEHVFRKLGVRDRVNAIRTAQHLGLVGVPSDTELVTRVARSAQKTV